MDKYILVTGASSGIGEATVRYLNQEGYHTVLVARNEEKLKKLVDELGNNACYYIYDFEDLEHIERIFDFCKEKEIKLDGMVHCAGMVGHYPVKVLELDYLHEVMDVNAHSFLQLGKYFSRSEYSNKGASIVAMSSTAAVTQRRGSIAYSGSKALINVYTNIMAKEFIRREIRVNSIMPAYVDTPMIQRPEVVANNPLGVIEVEQVSYLIEFLLSDKSKYITGAHIPISAGLLE